MLFKYIKIICQRSLLGSIRFNSSFCNIDIPVKQLQFTYSLSSGPGGQHAQKVSSKVDLRFHLSSADWLTEEVKSRLSKQNTLTKDGFIVFTSELTRSQNVNKEDAVRKLRQAITEAIQADLKNVETDEEKEEKRLNQLRAARNRLKDKRIQSQMKKERRPDW